MKISRVKFVALPMVRAFLSVCLFAAASFCAFAQDAKLAVAESAIENRIAKSGADVGVYFKTLDGKLEWLSRADDVFHAASTMKVPVMIELFRIHGSRKAEETILVAAEEQFIDERENADSALHDAPGRDRSGSR